MKDPDEMILHSLYGRKVVRIEENRVIKSGHNLRAHEAQTLRFVADNTTIPVPTVHEIRWEGSQAVAIVMDHMPGKRLDEAWETLDPGQKSSIARQLHSYLVQLRRLKGTYIGTVGHGKACIGQRVLIEGGPFDSEQQFNTFILEDLVKLPDVLQHYAKHALTDNHEIVFTHGDFAPRNILVEGDRVTAVLDWEDAGWYPEYWEYIKAMQHLKPMPDWPDYLTVILPPRYEKEYLGMAFLARLLRH